MSHPRVAWSPLRESALERLCRLELVEDLLFRFRSHERYDYDHQAGDQEGRKKLIYPEHATKGLDEVVPDEDHRPTREHSCDCSCPSGPPPEKREEHQRAERRSESRPGEAHDREDDAVLVKGDQSSD